MNLKKIVLVLAVLLTVSVYKHLNNNRAIVNLGGWRWRDFKSDIDILILTSESSLSNQVVQQKVWRDEFSYKLNKTETSLTSCVR